VGSQKAVVLHRDSAPNRNPILDCHTIAERRSTLDEAMLADITAGSDTGSVKNVGKCPDAGAIPYLFGINQSERMLEKSFVHGFYWDWFCLDHGGTLSFVA
jgi:hypothetical protein